MNLTLVTVVVCFVGYTLAGSCYNPLSPASTYGLFALSAIPPPSIHGCDSTIEGAVASAGPISLSNFNVATGLTSWPPLYTLNSNSDITFATGAVKFGSIIATDTSQISNVDIDNGAYNSNACCPTANNGCAGCQTGQQGVLDYTTIEQNLQEFSNVLSTMYSPSATKVLVGTSLELICGYESFNVFDGIYLISITSLTIRCSAGQTALINHRYIDLPYDLSGLSITLSGGITACHVLHHMVGISAPIVINNPPTPFYGSIFAPFANLQTNGATIIGSVIVSTYGTSDNCADSRINIAAPCFCFPRSTANTYYCCGYSDAANTGTETYCSPWRCAGDVPPLHTLVSTGIANTCDNCCLTPS